MRVFVTGATGAIGAPLVTQLLERGHDVVATARTPEKAARLQEQGAEAVVVDLLDTAAVRRAVAAARPDAIIHEATALANLKSTRNLDKTFIATNRLRTEGTDALIAAARETGVERFVAQSFAPWAYERVGDAVKAEDAPMTTSVPKGVEQTLAAIKHLERATVEAGGIALRYGGFYGGPADAQVEMVRKRMFPLVGEAGGVWSLVHVEDAAAATVLALERGEPGIYNVADDEPARVREWLPALAEVIGAKPPRRFPVWLARLVAGEAAVVLMTEIRGASNEKAKRELGWSLRYPSWRDGFRAAYG